MCAKMKDSYGILSSAVRVLGIALRSSGLLASALTH